jgi:hypothetical protein
MKSIKRKIVYFFYKKILNRLPPGWGHIELSCKKVNGEWKFTVTKLTLSTDHA